MQKRRIQMVRAVQFSSKPKVTTAQATAILRDFSTKVIEQIKGMRMAHSQAVKDILAPMKATNATLEKCNKMVKEGNKE